MGRVIFALLSESTIQLVGVVLTAVGVILVGWWQFGRTTHAVEETRDTLGTTGDDETTVVKLLYDVLEGQTGQDKRLAKIEARQQREAERTAALSARSDEHEHRLDRLESLVIGPSPVERPDVTTGEEG